MILELSELENAINFYNQDNVVIMWGNVLSGVDMCEIVNIKVMIATIYYLKNCIHQYTLLKYACICMK